MDHDCLFICFVDGYGLCVHKVFVEYYINSLDVSAKLDLAYLDFLLYCSRRSWRIYAYKDH